MGRSPLGSYIRVLLVLLVRVLVPGGGHPTVVYSSPLRVRVQSYEYEYAMSNRANLIRRNGMVGFELGAGAGQAARFEYS